MAWNLTDESYLHNQQNFTVGDHKKALKTVHEQHEVFTVLSRLKQFRDRGELCDLVLRVNNTEFNVHKVLLAGWSPKLASLMLGPARQCSEMIIQFADDKAFTDCLEYLYSGFVSVNDKNVLSLLELGRGLMIDALANICETYLQKTVSAHDFITKFFISLKYDLKVLEEIIADFVETNIAAVIEQPELLNLEPADFKQLLIAGKMGTVKQEVKFSLIISWVGYDVSVRDKYMLYLFSLINWTHPVDDLLIQISCTQNIFTTNELCLFQLLHSLVTSLGHHLGPFITAYPKLYSVYSGAVEGLSDPDVFFKDSQHLSQLASLVISPVFSKTNAAAKETTDTAVNTEIESDQTAAQSDIQQDQVEPEPETISMDMSEKLDGIEDSASKKAEKIEGTENTVPGSTHRRKSLPRKLPVKGPSKEPREKKRKTKKQTMKETVSGVSDVKENGSDQNQPVTMVTAMSDKESLEKCVDSLEENAVTGGIEVSNSLVKLKDSDKDKNRQVGNKDNKPDSKPLIKVSLKPNHRGLKNTKATKSRIKTLKTSKPVVPKEQTGKPVSGVPKRKPRFDCTYENCEFSAKTQRVLDKHVERVHLINVTLECWKCQFSANQMRALCHHLKEHFPVAPYACDVDGCSTQCLRLGVFIRHHMSHMKEKPYPCDMCQKSFATYNQLSCHRKLHEGRQFECDVCRRKFGTKGVMQQHRAIHFDNKPYLCDLCGFSTKHQSHLISHRKIHTGDVKRCSFPNCNYSTPKSAHMTQHMNSHLNIRNHVCQVCGKSFVVRSKLLRHERIHLKDKLYKCKQCEYQTSRTDRMKLHIESHGIKLKKGKNNKCSGFDYEESEPEIDYHQFYEKVQPSEDPGLAQITFSSASQNITFISDIKPMDVSFAASSSMIMDSYNSARLALDPLGTAAAVASIEGELQSAEGYQQNITEFDQL